MDLVNKGFLTKLTPSEKWYLITHPQHIFTIREDANKALLEAQRRFTGPGLHNGPGDAFRHCYWSALLARDIGHENALEFTTAHEAWSGNPPRERSMDLNNNSVGVDIGTNNSEASDSELSQLCNDALNSGRLITTTPAVGQEYPY